MNNFTIVNNLIIKEIGLNLHDTDTKSHAYREYLQQLGLYMALDLRCV